MWTCVASAKHLKFVWVSLYIFVKPAVHLSQNCYNMLTCCKSTHEKFWVQNHLRSSQIPFQQHFSNQWHNPPRSWHESFMVTQPWSFAIGHEPCLPTPVTRRRPNSTKTRPQVLNAKKNILTRPQVLNSKQPGTCQTYSDPIRFRSYSTLLPHASTYQWSVIARLALQNPFASSHRVQPARAFDPHLSWQFLAAMIGRDLFFDMSLTSFWPLQHAIAIHLRTAIPLHIHCTNLQPRRATRGIVWHAQGAEQRRQTCIKRASVQLIKCSGERSRWLGNVTWSRHWLNRPPKAKDWRVLCKVTLSRPWLKPHPKIIQKSISCQYQWINQTSV